MKRIVYATRISTIHDPDRFTLDDIMDMSSRTTDKILKQISVERKDELIKEVLFRLSHITDTICQPGYMCADSRNIESFSSPYSRMKKLSYMYSVITGWQTDEDLILKEEKIHKYEGA